MPNIVSRPGRARRSRTLVLTAAVVAAGLPAGRAVAQYSDSYYVGGAGAGSWSDPTNWSPYGVPGVGANAWLFNSDGLTRTVTFDSAAGIPLGYVIVDQTGTGSNTLVVPDFSLWTYTTDVGLSGTGKVVQTGGLHLTNELYLGALAGATGTYELRGGEIRMTGFQDQYIGFSGTGVFEQSGGINRAAAIFLGATLGSNGTYRLSGSGRLEVSSFEMIGGHLFDDTTGLFEQSGGTHLTGALQIGGSVTGGGTYRLSGGSLRATVYETVDRNGTFEQTGGTHAPQSLLIGGVAGAPGVYTISGGELSTFAIGVGGAAAPGSATMNVAGGTVTVTNSLTVNRTSGVLNFSGGSLTAKSLVNNAVFNATGGTFAGGLVNNATVRASTGAVLNVTGGIAAGSATNTAAARLVVESGARVTTNFVRQGSLEMGGASASAPGVVSIRRKADGGDTSVVNSLSVQTDADGTPLGRVDLADTALVVDYTGTSPLATVRGLLRAGYAGGTWAGNGLTSSVAAASDGRAALAYGEASDWISPAGGTFQGQAVDGTAVLVQYALAGDANLDGAVTKDDLMIVTHHMNDGDAAWSQGDFDYDGRVQADDLQILLRNYRQGTDAAMTASFDGQVAAALAEVPEPGGLGAVAVAAVGVGLKRRRRRRSW